MTAHFGVYDHWKVEHDRDDIVWLALDRSGETNNTLSEAVIRELGDIICVLDRLSPAGVVISSAKDTSFIVGADIREFDQYDKASDVSALITQGHAVFARLENLNSHTVAAVHGMCLGGGLELALSCNYIIASNMPDTRVGLPEVKLGIFPGLGGTTRLTERVGGLAAMQLMLTAKTLSAGAARQSGVFDELVNEFGSLHWAARRAVLSQRRPRRISLLASLTNRQPIRAILARVLKYKTAQKVNPEHYPAPFQMIDLWNSSRDNRRRMFDGEAEKVGNLMVGETAKNLRRVFFLSERMKGLGKTDGAKVRRVHVIGAGVMGGDIAAWCALQGLEVTLQDRELKYIKAALKRATKLFKKRLKKTPAVLAAQSRLIADVGGKGVSRADVVIEAIFEDADAKRALYADIEPHLADHAVLASNTSALSLTELARDLKTPSRLIGLHFFNPVAKMPLLEVVHSSNTGAKWVAAGCSFATQINRFPLPTKSTAGFLVNRILAPYLMEALTLKLEGVDIETIDAAAIRFGMPVGPIELADVVGLDVCMQVAETLATGDVEAHRALLQRKLDNKTLGKKTGRGFYIWKKGRAERRPVDMNSPYGDQLAERLMKPFLSECQAASAQGIVEDDDLLDAGIIFGTGFAPFRGGPMQYLKEQGDLV